MKKGFKCKCGTDHTYSSYVYAHWNETIVFNCHVCDLKWNIFKGKNTLIKTTSNQLPHQLTQRSNVMKKTQKSARKNSSTKKNSQSKVDLARQIFQKMFGKSNIARKDIITEFQVKVKLTPLGAATYYYNLTKEVSGAKKQTRKPVKKSAKKVSTKKSSKKS